MPGPGALPNAGPAPAGSSRDAWTMDKPRWNVWGAAGGIASAPVGHVPAPGAEPKAKLPRRPPRVTSHAARPARRWIARSALTVLAVLGSALPSGAFERIAVVAPLGDRHEILGQQVLRGAREALGLPPEALDDPVPLAANDDAPTPGGGTDAPAGGESDPDGSEVVNSGDGDVADSVTPGLEEGPDPEAEPVERLDANLRDVELIVISDPCRGGERAPEDGAEVAEALLEADVDAVVGLICWPTLDAVLTEGTLDGLPMVTSGVRAAALTERRRAEGWQVWRVAPRVGDEAEAIADLIFREWRGEPYALLDDGTIYGRELSEAVALRLGQRGTEPVMAESYRPAISRQFGLARRLGASGAERVFIAGERRDAAIIARDAIAAGLRLAFLGGDAMRAVDDDVPLPVGVEAVVLEPALGTGYRATTRAAVETLLQAEDLALARGFSLEDALNTGEFGTAIGSVRFDRLGDLRRNLFVHARWNGRDWVPLGGERGGNDPQAMPGGVDATASEATPGGGALADVPEAGTVTEAPGDGS